MRLKQWFRDHPQKKQKDMARDLEVSKEYLSGIVNGRRRPSPDLALKISEATAGEISVLELLYPTRLNAKTETVEVAG